MSTSTLPAAVAAYVDAANAFDTDALAATFTEDAMVNDARREFWGRPAIREWLAAEMVGDRVTMEVVEVREHAGGLIVDAVMDGRYDKTGLPDPLVLTHYLVVRGGRIAQLVIILNEARTRP
ncbi:MAG TPA: nuclear transport factor 2 family protein [Pseudonocardia sp.]